MLEMALRVEVAPGEGASAAFNAFRYPRG